MDKHQLPIPEENIAIYELLYNIEVGLRELIIQSLENICGPHWWKPRLPSDVIEDYRKAREWERNIKWCRLVSHHPIYYIDFSSLKKVIERTDNWNDVFKPIFKRKDILISTLSELEPIRNKIAHNRKAMREDMSIVEGAYEKIANAIGKERFHKFVSKCTLADDLPGNLLRLQKEARGAFKCCTKCYPIERLEVWENISNEWWFDDDYLGCELDTIKAYFLSLINYSELPRFRGCGHKIEAWVKIRSLEEQYAKASEIFSKLLYNIRGG